MCLDCLNRCIFFVNYLLFVYDVLGPEINELDLLDISKAALEALIFLWDVCLIKLVIVKENKIILVLILLLLFINFINLYFLLLL